MLEIDQFIAISAQVASLQNQLTTQLGNINLGVTQSASVITNIIHQAYTWCKVYGSSVHKTYACAANPEFVNYVENVNRQG